MAKKVVERFSPEGYLVSSELSLYSGGPFEISTYSWEDSRLTSVAVIDGNGKLLRTLAYDYLETGKDGSFSRLVTTKTAGGKVVYRELQYQAAAGLLARVEVLGDGNEVILQRDYGYDDEGRCVWETASSGENLLWIRKSAYSDPDPQGNWQVLRETAGFQYTWSQPRYIIRRTLF